MTNLEGRVLRRRRAVDPPAGTRGELWIMAELAARLGAPGSWSAEPEDVFEELRRASAGGRADYSGISYADLDAGALRYWPCPAPGEHAGRGEPKARGEAGTPRVFLDRFAHPDGRAQLVPVRGQRPPGRELLNRPGTLTLTTGRYLEHYQSGNQTRRVKSLYDAAPAARLQIHPATAIDLGLADGDHVEVTSARGTSRARAALTADIRPDTVFLPFHFSGDETANRVVAAAADPVSGMPEFKAVAVTLRKLRPTEPTPGTAESEEVRG